MFECVGESNASAICVGGECPPLESHGVALGLCWCLAGQSVHCPPKSMCVVSVIPVCVQVFPPYVRFVCLHEGCDFRVLL